MNSQFSFIPACLLLLLQIVPSGEHAEGRKHVGVRLAGITITMTLEKRGPNFETADWPAGTIRLIPQSVAVTKGKTIHEILKEAHVFPDVESFAVVYALNPDIAELRNLKVTKIKIPRVSGGPKLEAAFDRGFVVFLTAEKEKKEQFNRSVQALERVVQKAATFGPEQFENTQTRDSIIGSLNSTSAILVGINQRIMQRFGRPITREALGQLNAEANLLENLISGKAANKGRIDKSEHYRIAAIEKDVRLKGRAFSEVAAGDAPDRYPEIKVIVKTLREGNAVSNLRIYYVPEALKGDDSEVHPFGILSSPANKDLPEADYCFWAAKDPSKTPVTNELCLEIRRNKFEVQLTVLR
jgi:hypothetical protein